MLPKVGGDELLERAGSHGAVGAIDGQRHDLPVERRADQVSRYLALSERAVGKIIERRFARRRLVDRECLRTGVAADVREVGVVGAVRHQATRLDPAPAQQALLGLVTRERRRLSHR